jgi:hypothetical protein
MVTFHHLALVYMKRILLSVLFLTAIFPYAFCQQYYVNCLTESMPDYYPYTSKTLKSIQTNASGEIAFVGSNGDMHKRDRLGSNGWNRTFANAGFTAYQMDNSGFVYVLTEESGIHKLYKLAATNGANAWTPKTYTSGWRMRTLTVDNQGNIYVGGDRYSSTLGGYEIYLVKYNSAGTLQWEYATPDWVYPLQDFFGPNIQVLVNKNNEVYLSVDLDSPDYQYVAKLSSNGTTAWERILDVYSTYETGAYLDPDDRFVVYFYNSYYSVFYSLHPTDSFQDIFRQLDVGKPIVVTDQDYTYVYGLNTLSLDISLEVSVFNPDFTLVTTILTGEQSFIYGDGYPHSIVVRGPDIYVSGHLEGTDYLYFIEKYQLFGGNKWKIVDEADDLALDYQGDVLTPDRNSSNGCVRKITTCGNTTITITQQPAASEVCPGNNVAFTAAATGLGVTYYWFKDGQQLTTSSKFKPLSGTLTVVGATINDIGQYTCTVRDGCLKTVTTQAATFSITSSPSLTLQPIGATTCSGSDAIFQLTATGGKNVKYQWKKGATVLAESSHLVGTKTNKLTIKAATNVDAGEYHCEVTGDCYPVIISQKANLNVTAVTAITKHPVSVSSCAGKPVTFTIDAAGGNVAYQWKKGTTNLTESASVTGTKTNTLTLTSLAPGDAGDYTCVVTGLCGASVTSNSGTLAVTTEQQITAHPQSKTVCTGTTTTFSVTTSGTPASYQWLKGNTPLTNTGKYSGVTTATMTITSPTDAEGGVYSCIVVTSCGTQLISNSAQMAIGATAAITGKSADQTICEGLTSKFSITTSGAPGSYQWKRNGVVIANDSRYSGANGPELFVVDLVTSDAGNFTCEITSACGTKQTSGNIKLAVTQKASINDQPGSQRICEGIPTTLRVDASGSGLTYQWKRNGVNIADGTVYGGVKTAALTIKAPALSLGGLFTCNVTGCNGVLSSADAVITVNSQPDLVLVEDIDCATVQPAWSSIVTDLRNTNGNYSLFLEGSDEPLDIMDITKAGTYLIVKNTGFCADTIQWENECLITGVDEYNVTQFSLAPNPSQGMVKFVREGFVQGEYEVFDLTGSRVMTGSLMTSGEIDMVSLSNGIYMIRIRDKQNLVHTSRIVIQH